MTLPGGRDRRLHDGGVAAAGGDFQGTDKPFSATLPSMLQHRRIWLSGGRPFQRHKGLIENEAMAPRRHFTQTARRQFRGILVMLWPRR